IKASKGDAYTQHRLHPRSVAEPALRGYHLLPSVRADLLARLNRMDEAHAEYERAAALARNRQERTLLLERAARCRPDD
ncbi:hypothetical protein ACQCR9_23135, partial [Ralstonia pseudosolanacearum]